jgi:2-polyprenyl-3-methyl-5-hydroxy-6-metoxy-1,4-benzoquinol methylase
MIVQAVVKPGRNTVLLPYRLIRLYVAGFKKRKTMTAKGNNYTEVRLNHVKLSAHTARIKEQYIERFGAGKGRLGVYDEADWKRIEYVSSLLPKAKSVLDIGIGNGAFLNLLILLNRFQGMGIDIRRHSKFAMLFESQLYRIMYASVTNLPFRDRSIDVVTCMEVLEHLDKQSFVTALSEIRRVSRFFIATVPYNEPETRPSYHNLRFTDSDLLTYFPHGEFILLKKSTGTDWMIIIERS